MSTTVYTYNDRLVGVGNDQILGTSQGGGASYTAGDYISIDNDEISVTGISAGNGTLTIVQNVTGAPLEITYPTDVAPDAVFYQINSVTGYAYTNGYTTAVINYYYGETPADFNGSDDSILFTINDNISNVSYINFYYVQTESSMGGPNLATSSIAGDSNGIIQSGTYKVKAYYNQAAQGGYGKYLQIMFQWRNYATDAAQSLQWAQEALSKITFFGVVRPDPSLGVTVNLDRYYLGGNIVSYKPTNSGLPAQIWLNPETKKQEVYLPNTVPSSWNLKTVVLFQYGSSSFSYSNADSSHDYIAYKYDSTTRNYEFAELVHTDYNAKKFTFARTYNGAIEYWIADCTNGYYSTVWSTETLDYATEIQAVSGALDNYIPYAASGVSLPNSKFEIDTNGQAYKLISEASEIDYSCYYDAGFYYGYSYALPDSTETPPVMKAGTYRIIVSNDDIKSFKFSANSRGGFAAYNGLVLPVNDNHVDWIITEDIQVTDSPDTISIYAWSNSDGTGSIIPIWTSDATVKYIVPAVTEEYLTDGDLELNSDNQVTAIDGHTLVGGGGSTYTAGDYISIENDEIAVTGVGNLVAGNNITITESGNNITISSEGGGSTYTAGKYISIDGNDVIAVTGLAPVSGSDGIAVNDNVVSLDTPVEIVAGENITISVTGASAIFSAQTVGVTEAQVYDATVTAVQAATGAIPTFTEGNCIDITSNAISWETTAGITDIVSVTALPANPVATVIYLIPET